MKKAFSLTIFICFIISSLAQQPYEDSLNKVITDYKDEAEVARAYNALGYEYTRSDVARSTKYFYLAIAISKKIGNNKRLSSSYSALVYLFHDAAKPDSAMYYLNLVKELVTQATGSEKDIIGSNYYSVAGLYYKKTSNYQKAIPFFEKAIALNIKTGNKESTAGQMLNLGNTYSELGNYKKATEQHLEALRLFEALNSDRGISFCYQSLSNSFTKLKQYNTAILYTNKSLKIKTRLNDRQGLGSAQSGLGEIYLSTGDYEKALYHFKLSNAIAKELKNIADEQENLFNIGKVFVAKKDRANAVDYFNSSKILAKQLRDTSSIAAIDAALIALQTDTNKASTAEDQLKISIRLFEERGDLNRKAAGFKNMADFYAANKQFEKALEYNNKYYQILDSVRNNELLLQVKKMDDLYNVDKKEKEIALLKKDQLLNEASLQRQKIIKYALIALVPLLLLIGLLSFNRYRLRSKMKQLKLRYQIAADLHDEVGSSLSSIHMLSQMATQQGNGATQKAILTRMSSNAKETMDKMGDIIWMIKPDETEAAGMKQRMERFAYEICSSKNIAVSMQLDELEKAKLSMEQRKNIYLIFKEAVNNAVKYADTASITISAAVQNKELVLLVKDEGKGFDSNLVKKGNGLDNIKNRATEMAGVLSIDSAAGKGTVVKLTMPVQV